MIYPLLRRLLFRLDPESAHELAVANIARLEQVGIAMRAIAALCRPPAGAARELLGLRFPSPVGIAAGFDKNAEMMPLLAALGFGFLEIGTVTLHPQPGNPRPRMFRYPAVRGLINRMGFNNDGAEVVAARLDRWRAADGPHPPLLVNIGKNREVSLADAPGAYAACYARLASHADAVVLNLSSPNTPNLRDLQRPEHLVAIIRAVREAGERKPLAVKIAPDLGETLLGEVSDVCVAHSDAMICTNTTVDRLEGMNEAGGLSGAPLFTKATEVLRRVRALVGPRYPLIGVGGVFTAADARAKIEAGADLVQIYTGFIYEGPALPSRLARALAGTGRRVQ